jgi:hypothetical protein
MPDEPIAEANRAAIGGVLDAAVDTASPEGRRHSTERPPLRRCVASAVQALPARAWYALLAACFVAAVSGYRIGAIQRAVHPGHADAAFYYGVAQNLRAGRGPIIDYQWEFLSGQHPLPQYAFGYWLPATSVLMSLALHVGSSLTAALAVNVIMSIAALVGVFMLARLLSPSPWVPAAAAAIAAVQPILTWYVVQSEAAVCFAGFALLTMAAAVGARNRAWLWPAAGVLAALANLSRSEGLILIVVVLLAAIASGGHGRARLLRGAGIAVPYLAVMSPLYWEDMRHFGSLMPPASGAFPFITTYENIFALHVPRSLSALLDGGLEQFLRLRVTALDQHLNIAFRAAGTVEFLLLIAFTAAGTVRSGGWPSLRESNSRGLEGTAAVSAPSWLARAGIWAVRLARGSWFVPAGFAIATFLFYAWVSPVVASAGAIDKGMVAILPVVVIAGVDGLSRLRLRPALVAAVVGLLVALPSLNLAAATNAMITLNNAVGERFASWKPQLAAEAACLGRPVVVMTRAPWEFTQATGYPSVMIPNGPLDEILATAERYHVTAIDPTPWRAALTPVSKLLDSGVLQRPATLRDTSLYRIAAAAPDARC